MLLPAISPTVWNVSPPRLVSPRRVARPSRAYLEFYLILRLDIIFVPLPGLPALLIKGQLKNQATPSFKPVPKSITESTNFPCSLSINLVFFLVSPQSICSVLAMRLLRTRRLGFIGQGQPVVILVAIAAGFGMLVSHSDVIKLNEPLCLQLKAAGI